MAQKPGSQGWWLYTKVLPVVTGAVEEIIKELPEEEENRHGGYFCLCKRGMSWPPLIVARIGEVLGGRRRDILQLRAGKGQAPHRSLAVGPPRQ